MEIETLSPPEYKVFLENRKARHCLRFLMFTTEKGGVMYIKAARANKKGTVTGEIWNGTNHMPIYGRIFSMIGGTGEFKREGFVTVYYDRILQLDVNKDWRLIRES